MQALDAFVPDLLLVSTDDRQPLQFGRLHLLDDLADHAKGQIASPTNQPGSRMDSPLASKVSNSSPAAFEAPHEASKHRPATCPPLNEPYEGPARLYPVPSNRTRGPCSCTPVAPFILFSIQRSGSGWVESLLKNHSAIHSHGEQFNNRNLKTGGWKAARAVLEGVFNLELVAEEAECLAAVGLKWMLNQVRPRVGHQRPQLTAVAVKGEGRTDVGEVLHEWQR